MPPTFQKEVHGILFKRGGGPCDPTQCVGCFNNCVNCTHGDERGMCTIYNARHKYCDECGSTHQICIDFPDHPYLRVIYEKTCTFWFVFEDGSTIHDLPHLTIDK